MSASAEVPKATRDTMIENTMIHFSELKMRPLLDRQNAQKISARMTGSRRSGTTTQKWSKKNRKLEIINASGPGGTVPNSWEIRSNLGTRRRFTKVTTIEHGIKYAKRAP